MGQACAWAWTQSPFRNMALLRSEMLLALYSASLLAHVTPQTPWAPVSHRTAWKRVSQKLAQGGFQYPAWAWGLVGRDASLDEIRWTGPAEDGTWGTIEGWNLLEGGASGVDPFDDPEWLAETCGVAPSAAWSDRAVQVMRLRLGADDGVVQSTEWVPLHAPGSSCLDVVIPSDAWPVLVDDRATQDWATLWRLGLTVALRLAQQTDG